MWHCPEDCSGWNSTLCVLNNSWSHFPPPSSIFLPLLHHHHLPPHMISPGAHLAPETVTMFGNRFFEDVRSHWRGDWCLCSRTVRVSWKWGRRGGAQQGQISVIALTEEHWLARGNSFDPKSSSLETVTLPTPWLTSLQEEISVVYKPSSWYFVTDPQMDWDIQRVTDYSCSA